MTAATLATGMLLLLAGGLSGSLVLLYRARRLRLKEQEYGITCPHLRPLAAALGAGAGVGMAVLLAYYLSLGQAASFNTWVGRFSYFLIIGASAGHLLAMAWVFLHLDREERSWQDRRGPGEGTLGLLRMRSLERLRRQRLPYPELRARDEQAVDELVGLLGNLLVSTRRGLPLIPFYGYLGTVCGILMMSEELARIGESTEAFKALRAMAGGLVLAFRTTLVGLLAYLPLRKLADYLLARLAALEETWGKALEDDGER